VTRPYVEFVTESHVESVTHVCAEFVTHSTIEIIRRVCDSRGVHDPLICVCSFTVGESACVASLIHI